MAWDISTAAYDNRSFLVDSETNNPHGVFFKPDGTKVYVLDLDSATIFQYSLSSAWDISTASYDSVSFSVTSQESLPTGVSFKSDGAKMYIVGQNSDRVRQYTLSTPWVVSTAVYDNVSLLVSGQDQAMRDIFFKPDGAKMYLIGQLSDAVHQYTLGTPWDLSTATYDSVSFSVLTETGGSEAVFFQDDGTKMFVVPNNPQNIYQYDLGTPWDVSSATYGILFATAHPTTGLFFKPDGKLFYVVDANSVYQFRLTSSPSPSTSPSVSPSVSPSASPSSSVSPSSSESPSISSSPSPGSNPNLSAQNIYLAFADNGGDVQTFNVGHSDYGVPIYYELETQELDFDNRLVNHNLSDKMVVFSENAHDSKIQIKEDENDYKTINIDMGKRVSSTTLPTITAHFATIKWSGNTVNKQPILEGFYFNKIEDKGVLNG